MSVFIGWGVYAFVSRKAGRVTFGILGQENQMHEVGRSPNLGIQKIWLATNYDIKGSLNWMVFEGIPRLYERDNTVDGPTC